MGEVKVRGWFPSPPRNIRFPTPRPAYSILDCTKIARVFGINPRPWQVAFADMMKQLRSSEDL
jgi:dTDP-4-dehydrorhamnose reductase